jgi:hypothetical protein
MAGRAGKRATVVVMAAAVAVAIVTVVVLVRQPASPSRLLVGLDDDSAKWVASPDRLLAHYRRLGVRAVRLWIPWHGEAHPRGTTTVYLDRAERLAARGQRVVLAIFGFARDAPVTAPEVRRYCAFARNVLGHVHRARDVVIWNEANAPTYWPPASGAAGYERLLARCWDVLHAQRRDVNVIDSTASAHAPAAFVLRLGAVYRLSGRTRPLVDTFGHNPYPHGSREPPTARHGTGRIAIGDYALLRAALQTAFSGTGQPLPGQGETTVWYLEDGYQSSVPHPRRPPYYGRETAADLASPELQAARVAGALLLAACQPGVGAFFNFELRDEDRLAGWQSGLLWRDGTSKPAYDAYRTAALAARGGGDCAGP